MAHFMAVTDNVIRVQLPGGAMYAPALHEAAAKTGARSGLPSQRETALNDLVRAAVEVLNAAGASVISLEMTVHTASISTSVVGTNDKPPAKKLITTLETVANEHETAVSTRAGKSSFSIRFKV